MPGLWCAVRSTQLVQLKLADMQTDITTALFATIQVRVVQYGS